MWKLVSRALTPWTATRIKAATASTCFLSKRLIQSDSKSPNLIFHQTSFSNVTEIENQQPMFSRFSFFNSVHNTLLRYKSSNLSIDKLSIILRSLDAFTSPLLDKSLRLAFDLGVQDLFISLEDRHCYSLLPSSMFQHPNVLTSLTVKYFELPRDVISNATMFPFLKTLYLHMVITDDEMIQRLLSRSPSLEKVTLFHLFGLTKFRVCNLAELKVLDIIMGLDIIENAIEKFEIDIEDAPSLSYLRFSSWASMFLIEVPFLLKVGSAPNLKVLELVKVNVNDNELKELVAKLPLLEDLKIVQCERLRRIDIASRSLKHVYSKHCGVVEAKIDAPSLLTLDHNDDDMLLLSVNNSPKKLVYRYRS